MGKFLKWSNGLTIAFALTITPILLSSNVVVEGHKPSTLFTYNEGSKVESVVILGKGMKDIMNDNQLNQISKDNLYNKKYEKIIQYGNNVEINKIKEYNVELKQHMDELRKQKEEQERLEELQKQQEEMQRQQEEIQINNPTITVNASAYVSTCGGCSGRTVTGYDVTNTIYYNGYRIIATDTNEIPLYSIVRITYDNISFDAICLDTGGAIKGKTIDLLVKSYNEAIQFGRKNVQVEVIRRGA